MYIFYSARKWNLLLSHLQGLQLLESAYDMLRYLFKTLAVTADFSSFFLSSRVQTSCARSAKAHVFFKCSNCMQLLFFFLFFFAQLCIATFVREDRYFPWQDFSEPSALSAAWIMLCLLLMAVREVITTPFEGGWFSPQPWQVKSNVIVQWKSIALLCVSCADNLQV